jgi:hypothetical protein
MPSIKIKVVCATVQLLLTALIATGNQGTGAQTQVVEPLLVSLCDLLKQPPAYVGKPVVIKVRVTPLKDGAFIWSPACPSSGISPLVAAEATSENGLAEFQKAYHKFRPFLATLTGLYEPEHVDETRKTKRRVFLVLAAKEIAPYRQERAGGTPDPNR